MSQGNQSCLRFSLEESVWFQKGQEVAELVSISLDPNITIQENDQYVSIQGSLQLSGEYKRHEAEGEVEELQSSPKFVQLVEDRGEGVCEFSHRFPVDITIPNNRIQSVYDLDVEVESFDYAFPERSCMKLTADLTITGLYGDQQHAPSNQEEVETEEEPELEPVYRSSAALVEVEEAEEQTEIEVEQVNETFLNNQQEEVLEVQEEEEDELYAPFEAEARKQPEVVQLEEEKENDNSDGAPQVQVNEVQAPKTPEISFSAQRKEETKPQVAELYHFENKETHEETVLEVEQESPTLEVESSSSEPMIKKKKSSKTQTLSLTEFFARKEEEDVAKLKVCIVQQGDTLDVLADRYEVSVQQLLRVNRLEVNQDVYEGQVLYIPATIAQN